MQEEFIDYIRRQTRSYALVLMPVIFGLAVIALGASLLMKEGKEMMQTSLLFGVPALVVGVLLALSFKHIALVELLTPVMFIGYTLILCVVNFTDIVGKENENMRKL